MATAAAVLDQCWPDDTVPVVSVLVRAYNHEQFLVQCLQSILHQVVDFPVEIIAHDDASTDGTAAIVNSYSAEFPHIIKAVLQTENQFSRQRKCLPLLHELARGAFIAYCDGDDAWTDQNKLARQVGFLHANPACVLSFHDAIHIDSYSRIIQTAYLTDSARRDYTQEELGELKWGWMLLGTIVHRHLKIKFPPEFNLAPNGDNFLPILLAAGGGAGFQAEVGPLAYRQHAGGIWSGKTRAEWASMHLQTYLQIAAYFVRIGDVVSARKIIAGRLSAFVRDYFQETSRSA